MLTKKDFLSFLIHLLQPQFQKGWLHNQRAVHLAADPLNPTQMNREKMCKVCRGPKKMSRIYICMCVEEEIKSFPLFLTWISEFQVPSMLLECLPCWLSLQGVPFWFEKPTSGKKNLVPCKKQYRAMFEKFWKRKKEQRKVKDVEVMSVLHPQNHHSPALGIYLSTHYRKSSSELSKIKANFLKLWKF